VYKRLCFVIRVKT